MWQFCVQMISILALYIITPANCKFELRHKPTEVHNLSHFITGAGFYTCESKICSCSDFVKLENVNCESSGGNVIQKLSFSDSEKEIYLKKEVFYGLIINVLFLNISSVTVDERFLEGIISLSEFNVEQSGIEDIPDFRFVNNSIAEIKIQSSRLKSLDGENLQQLSSLQKVSFYKNSIHYIGSEVFKGTDNIVYMDLSHNLLTYIPPKLLDPMKELKYFNASHNNLQHVHNLFSITLPNEIKLDFNNIADVNNILSFNFEKDGHLFHINNSYFDVCKVQLLDLRYNSIQEPPKSFFSCYNNASDEPARNEMESKNPRNSKWRLYFDEMGSPTENTIRTCTYRIGRLELAGNALKSLKSSLQYSEIRSLNMTRNHLEFLTEEDFNFVREIRKLYLQENQIRQINKYSFKSIRNSVKVLDLSANDIMSVNGSIRYMPELIVLNLAFNKIQFFSDDEFTGLRNLKYLHLEHNQIKDVGPLRELPVLEGLNIKSNNVELIRIHDVPGVLKAILYSDNPFKCDCTFQKFAEWRLKNPALKTDVDLCLSSERHSTKNIKICPAMCTCKCADIQDDHLMLVDCRSRNLHAVPEFFGKNTSLMKDDKAAFSDDRRFYLQSYKYSSLDIVDYVKGINLENNKIEWLDESQLPWNLTHLYMSNNKLKRVSEKILDMQLNLKEVSLSGNPWICDCKALPFQKWLASKNSIVRDIKNVRCGSDDKAGRNLTGRLIWNLSEHDLCPTTNDVFILVVSFSILTSVIFCLATKVLYTKYELNIKVFLYYRGFTFVKEADLDCKKYFDAFISFCHKDDEYVIKDIVSGIEKKNPNIRLCLHYRHFLAGELIQDNITYAVQNSKKTVIILSRNFLQSDWCLLEFKAAHLQAMKDKVHRIIVVKFGNLPKEIDPLIKVYLDNTTYLTWGDDNFWNKFLFVLPSRCSTRNDVSRSKGDNETVLNFSPSDL